MNMLHKILLASATGLALAGAAQAADAPTKKTPPAATKPDCHASFWTWLDSTAADCPLSAYGVTVYGTIDMGGGYNSAASRFNRDFPQGVQEMISKTGNGGRWQWVPNGLSQSNVGVKIKEQIAPNWYVIGDVNSGFDPYSLHFADGPKSLDDNNYVPLANQTSNSDSSRSRWDNTRAYLGISNTTFGTLTAGRQYAFSNDLASAYDPTGGAYAFSLIGNSSTWGGGTGETETARYNTSIKYQVTYNGFRAGVLAQVGGWQQGNGAKEAYQADVGGDFAGFSVDAVYSYAKDAVNLSSNTSGAPNGALKATLADLNAGIIGVKYKWQALTLFGGYEYARLSSPSDANDYLGHFYTLNGYTAKVGAADAYKDAKIQQVLWAGAKYAVLSNLDVMAGYYYGWQNNYDTGGAAACGPNTKSAIAGAAPQGSLATDCAGHLEAVSGLLDWRPVKRVDIYSGVMVSHATGGIASGYIKNTATAFTSGLRVNF
jgi:predicted porin